jgi:hypothetical protein
MIKEEKLCKSFVKSLTVCDDGSMSMESVLVFTAAQTTQYTVKAAQ